MDFKRKMEVDFEFFSTRFIDGVLWMDFQKKLLIQSATDLACRDSLLSYLDEVCAYDPVKVLVFRSFLDEAGHRDYLRFFQSVASRQHNLDLHRLFNFYASLVVKLCEMNKLIIHAASGNVIPLFLNTSLACDYRIAADNTIYKNTYLDLGILPIGGGAFFLPRLMGQGKALELMTLKKEFTAKDALAYGIIDKILPADGFETGIIETARRFESVAGPTLSGLKRLLRFSSGDLKKYLEFEDREFFRIIHRQTGSVA